MRRVGGGGPSGDPDGQVRATSPEGFPDFCSIVKVQKYLLWRNIVLKLSWRLWKGGSF